jgi:hypothetical protein
MKIDFPGPAISNIFVMHAPFFRFHSITVNPSFECSEQNHHSDFVPFSSAVHFFDFDILQKTEGEVTS